ncbi:hypothetical protein QVD17_39692 [Tagetes erecta]|uniref:Zinc finger, CCHC-type n=1 Tax=Tagetes erecta TaxID=13708 RepID=A0AAD8NHC8_TARER|nr:hypothetical protein QVD17_39692 [Tagetes erecta]
MIASIEQNTDLDTVSMDEIIGKLKAYEERIKNRRGSQVNNQDKLLFTRQDNHNNRGGRSGGHGRGRFKPSRGNYVVIGQIKAEEKKTPHKSLETTIEDGKSHHRI